MACYGLSEDYIRKGPVAVDQTIAEALEGRVVIISDAATDPRTQYPEKARKKGIVTILSVPVRLGEEILGLMRVYTDRPRRFTPADVHLLELAASISAKTIEKAIRQHGDGVDAGEFRRAFLETEWGRWSSHRP